MQQQITLELTTTVTLDYDSDSKEFKESLEAYKKAIYPEADQYDMLKQIAYHVVKEGHYGLIEGIGYVGYNGQKKDHELYSGVIVGRDYDDFEIEIL